MAKDYSKFSHEELIKYIEELQHQLKSEKYGLYWDKTIERDINVQKLINNIPVLKRDNELFMGGTTNNILIEGDNIQSLISLNMICNFGMVDVVYIDPPYNTGNKDFKYNDSYVDSDDGFFHSKWLSFMNERLLLCRNLMKDDAVIFISIDDNEYANLKLLCDSIFGEQNFIVNMIITSAPAGTQSSVDFAQQHSYCLVYRKSAKFRSNYTKLTEEEIKEKYSYGKDSKGRFYIERIWKRGIGGRMEDVPSLHFPVWYNVKTKEILIDEEINDRQENDFIKIIPYQTIGVLGRWTWSREKMIREKDHLIVVQVAGEWKLHKKVYETEDKGRKPYSIIGSKLGRTELGSLELKEIMNDKVFDYPKYSQFIKYLISLHSNSNGVVLDFFAGSGTTGQAVLELNKEDGGNRRFILCTNNENNICTDVTYPRLKTVITGIRPDGTKYSDGIPANLIYYKTDFIKDSNNTDQAKYCLVEKVDELLCISEDIFVQLERNDYSSHYVSNDETRHMFIYSDYYNETKFNEFKQRVLNTSGTKVVYIFSSDNNVDDTLFEGIKDVEVKPIPSKIYEIYKEIVEDIKRG